MAKSKSPNNVQQANQMNLLQARRYSGGALGLYIFALVVAAIAAGVSSTENASANGFSMLAMLFLGGFAATTVGIFFGFLLGIPRQLGDNGDTANNTDEARQNATNLERISDWLTKILIGAGLTQITEIPTFLWKVAGKLAEDIGPAWAHPVMLCAIVAGAMIGLLVGHIMTRLWLPVALANAAMVTEEAYKGSEKLGKAMANAEEMDDLVLDVSPEVQEDAKEIAKKRFVDLDGQDETLEWARAKTIVGDLFSAAEAYRTLLTQSEPNTSLLREAARTFKRAGRPSEAEKLLRRIKGTIAQGDTYDSNAITLETASVALYQAPPKGPTKALSLCETLGPLEGNQEQRRQFYIACAHGGLALGLDKSSDAYAKHLNGAAAALRAIATGKDPSRWARRAVVLFDTNDAHWDEDDDDFGPFRGEEVFEEAFRNLQVAGSA